MFWLHQAVGLIQVQIAFSLRLNHAGAHSTTWEVTLIWPRFDSNHRYEEQWLFFPLTLTLLVCCVWFSSTVAHKGDIHFMQKKKSLRAITGGCYHTHASIYSKLKIHSLSQTTRTSSMCVRAHSLTHTPQSILQVPELDLANFRTNCRWNVCQLDRCNDGAVQLLKKRWTNDSKLQTRQMVYSQIYRCEKKKKTHHYVLHYYETLISFLGIC